MHEALGKTWELIGYANRYIDDKKPWATVKHNEGEFLATMDNTVYILYNIAWMLTLFLPETADKIFTILGANRDAETTSAQGSAQGSAHVYKNGVPRVLTCQ